MGYVYPGQPRPFDGSVGVGLAAGGANQVIVAAPVAGFCIYVQNLTVDSIGTAAGAIAVFKPAGGIRFATFGLPAAGDSKTISFPGGWKLPAATALHADSPGPACFTTTTYTIGPDL